jgi:hypothetical protein
VHQLLVDFKKNCDSVRKPCKIFALSLVLKLVRLIKMYLNETYSRVRVGEHLSVMFPIKNGLKQGDA